MRAFEPHVLAAEVTGMIEDFLSAQNLAYGVFLAKNGYGYNAILGGG